MAGRDGGGEVSVPRMGGFRKRAVNYVGSIVSETKRRRSADTHKNGVDAPPAMELKKRKGETKREETEEEGKGRC